MRTLFAVTLFVSVGLGCGDELEPGGDGVDAGAVDDPLVFDEPAAAGSLEELQRDIIQERCSGERGLCHNGQFEPNLSTTANTYAWMVQRPSIENFDKLRVMPGDPDNSFLIDKLRNRDVGTQMPLGAEPLTEDEIARFETWINDGALRDPAASGAPSLNNPPKTPEIAIFVGLTRIDRPGLFTVPGGQTLTFRHSVEDFETPDESIFVGALIVSTNMGNMVLVPGGDDPALAVTAYDATDPPMGPADLLNYQFDVSIGANIDVVGADGLITSVSSVGLTFSAIPLYIDVSPMAGGIIAVRLADRSFTLE